MKYLQYFTQECNSLKNVTFYNLKYLQFKPQFNYIAHHTTYNIKNKLIGRRSSSFRSMENFFSHMDNL